MSFRRTKKIHGNTYEYEVESYWDKDEKKTKQRVIAYYGRVIKEDGERKVIPPARKMDEIISTSHIGKLILYYAAAQMIGLTEILEKYCPKKSYQILALVMNQLFYRRSLKKAAKWINRLPLDKWVAYSGESLTRNDLDAALRALCFVEDGMKIDHGRLIQEEMSEKCQNLGGKRRRYLFYDVTKVTYYGYKCAYAEKGYHPSSRGNWTIGVGLVTTIDHAFPVRCGVIPGSKNDTVTLSDMVHALKNWRYKGSMLIFDRGMVSKKNLQIVRGNGFQAICCCPRTRNEVIEALKKWDDSEITKWEHTIQRSSGEVVYAKGWKGELYGQKGKLVVVLDPEKKTAEKTNRDAMIKELNEITDRSRVRELGRSLNPVVVAHPGARGFKVDEDLVASEERLDGRTLLFCTDRRLRTDHIYQYYAQRDEIEKTFRCMKGELSLGPIRYQRPERIDAYITIVFLAYMLRAILRYMLKKSKFDLTVDDAFELMDGLSWVRYSFNDKIRDTVSRRTNEQKGLLKYLSVDNLLPAA